MLTIKEGVSLTPYGPNSILTSESDISQEALAHLQTRYPEDIEGELEAEKKEDKPAAPEAPKTITKAQLTAMAEKVKNNTASPEERDIVAAAKSAGKL